MGTVPQEPKLSAEHGYLHAMYMENQDTLLKLRNMSISESVLLCTVLLPCMTVEDLLQSLASSLSFFSSPMFVEVCPSQAKPD